MSFRIRLDDSRLLPELVDTLLRAECLARRVSETEVDVSVPHAPSPEQAERELRLYLSLWDTRYPDSGAELV